jgi:carboxyl-terminal processing protease
MNSKIRLVVLLPIILILLACRIFIPSLNPTPTHILATKNILLKPTSTFLPTYTSIPSVTFTPTSIPPSLTPTAAVISTQEPTQIPITTQLSIFENFWSIVNDTYVYPDFNGLDWNAIHQEYRQKIAAGLTNGQFYLALSEAIAQLGDDHSFFLDPLQVAKQEAEYQGKHDYVGIGVMVSAVPERQRAVILSVFSDGPAEAAGLHPRDSIISVDGTSILDNNGLIQDIVRGPEGTTISVIVQTPGEDPRELRLTRHRITGNYPVVYRVITTPDGKRIGYILLVTFEDSTVDEQVAAALQEMSADAPLDGLILDNRMNNGGSNTVLEPMLGYFAGGNLGYYLHHDEQRPLQIKLNDVKGSSQVPLIILVGSGTASFGEIFAGILQDIGRAYLIGTTTDGNVEILWGYDLEDGSQLWLANETFRPLNHPDQDWEKSGIIPDLTASGEFDQYSLDTDPAVLAAIGYLSEH